MPVSNYLNLTIGRFSVKTVFDDMNNFDDDLELPESRDNTPVPVSSIIKLT